MAPDRGSSTSPRGYDTMPSAQATSPQRRSIESTSDDGRHERPHPRAQAQKMLTQRAAEGHHLTLRGILVGLGVGIVICFSNMYFGLQSGWVSSMAMPSALIGFAFFKTVARHINYPFTPVENVLVQSVAGSVGTMPLGCGFVGVIPALNFMLTPEENGPLEISTWRLIVWAVGICFFGVVFAVPLRKQVIIREKLKFPSGMATALMIGVLHGEKGEAKIIPQERTSGNASLEEHQELLSGEESRSAGWETEEQVAPPETEAAAEIGFAKPDDWKAKVRLLIIAFSVSAIYTIVSYFIPQLRDVPIVGLNLAHNWLWTLNPSPAYVGQGIIMGPATTMHMLFGAILGWGILSPLAKKRGWAPGPVDDWGTGSKGWIVWVSLAIMLADSLVNLGWLVLRPLLSYARIYFPYLTHRIHTVPTWTSVFAVHAPYPSLSPSRPSKTHRDQEEPEPDAPPSHLVSPLTTAFLLLLSLMLCASAVHVAFPGLIPFPLTLLALTLALLLSVMGVRALGETDLNPVSGISKLTQLLFALVTPRGSKNAIIINLLAGALSESGALQAGDLLQDLKTGHLLGAAPRAQFWGQMVGSAVGAVVSAVIYRLYTRVYQVPGDLFQVPTGFVWVFTARLVTGKGLPVMVGRWAAGLGLLWAVLTAVRVWGTGLKRKAATATAAAKRAGWWVDLVPGGIAVAVGMYNTPSFTLARAAGGLVSWWWRRWLNRPETTVVVLASGLILGEGVCSIVNLALASAGVPHL